MRSKNRSHHRYRRAWVASLLVGFFLPFPLRAQEDVSTAARSSGEHVVRKGDTLWDLAQEYLKDPFRWTLIFDANRGTVKNPHRIFPAERLVIPGYGEMTITTEVRSVAPAATAVAATEIDRTRFYPDAEATEPDAAEGLEGEAAPPVRASEFQSAPWLGEPEKLAALGRVVRVADADTQDERLERYAFPFERVYVSYAGGSRPTVGDRQVLVSAGRGFGTHGRVITPVAAAEVVALADDVYTVRIVDQFAPVEPGATAIAADSLPALVGLEAEGVSGGPAGRVLGFSAEQLLPGIRDLVFVDLGSADGVELGDELVALAGTAELPSEVIARLRVIRVTEGSATAKIVDLTHGAMKPGTPVRVVRTLR